MTQHNQPLPGVVSHSLIALGTHIGERQLPNPGQIEIERDAIVISVAGSDARAWRQSVIVDSVSRDGVPGSAVEYVVLDGRLPDSGVRVRVEYLRRSPAPVRAARLAVAR